MNEPRLYTPRYRTLPSRVLNAPTAWAGIESILHDLISRVCPDGTRALEIGVDYGYSAVALSNFFASVTAVDTFAGDEHAGQRDPAQMFDQVRESLTAYPNIRLVRSDYRKFFESRPVFSVLPLPIYDLTHIDIVHTYEATYECGALAMGCSRALIFHDSESFPDVKRAVAALAENFHMHFYNFPECHGLGILTRRPICD